jgi:hypothetical protein
MIAELSLRSAFAPTCHTMRAMSAEVRRTYSAWCQLTQPRSDQEAQSAAALEAACAEAATDNWDGYGAQAVTYGVKIRAQEFLDALPAGVPLPTIAADPDGEVAFEWYVGPRQVFSVSIGSRYEVAYAGIFGANMTHGTEYFMDELPASVMENLRRLYGGNGVAG